MPHFILDYSSNLQPEADFDELFETLHGYVDKSPLFPLAGCRCRAMPCPDYRVGSGDPRFAYLHLNLRVGAGRSDEQLAGAGDEIMGLVQQWLQQVQQRSGLICALSFEISQIDARLSWKHNPVRAAMVATEH